MSSIAAHIHVASHRGLPGCLPPSCWFSMVPALFLHLKGFRLASWPCRNPSLACFPARISLRLSSLPHLKLSSELLCMLYSDIIMQTTCRKWKCLGKTLSYWSSSINLVGFTTKVPPALPMVNLPTSFIITQILFQRALTHFNSFFLSYKSTENNIHLPSLKLSE